MPSDGDPLPGRDGAVAGLQARWGAAAPRVVGIARASAPMAARRAGGPGARRGRHPPRSPPRARTTTGSSTPGFAALDAILGPGGLPEVGQRRHPRRRLQRPDDARAPGRGRGPGPGLGRGLAGSRAHASTRWRPSPAASDLEWLVVITPASLDEGLTIAGSLLAGRSVDLLVLDLPGGRLAPTDTPGPDRRSARPTGRARPTRRRRSSSSSRRPGLAGGLVDRRRRGDRPPPRARATVVDPARARRRRPAHGGRGRPQPLRPAGQAGDPPDPLRRGR